MAEERPTLLAVLIDGDNASASRASSLFDEIAKIGEAVVRRIYGDFTAQGLRGWNDVVARHALMQIQAPAAVKGKNASDIALVIDAMDLLHSGRYDGFCIVSSDSDFTRLAQRLREGGAEVYGFGERKTPESFRQACRRFFLVENLSTRAQNAEPEFKALETQPQPATDALPILRRAYERLKPDADDGWIPTKKMRKTILNVVADFDERSYGEYRLGDLAVRTGRFEERTVQGGGHQIREKPQIQKATRREAPARQAAKPVAAGKTPDKAPTRRSRPRARQTKQEIAG